jgi:hypothetical protein
MWRLDSSLLTAIAVASGRNGAVEAAAAQEQLDKLRGTPALRRILLHAGQALRCVSAAVNVTSAGMPVSTICFKSALLVALFFEAPPAPSHLLPHLHQHLAGSADPPFDLASPVDWDAVGLAGVPGYSAPPAFPDDISLCPAARFIHSGGRWCWNGHHTAAETLNWTAEALIGLSCGGAKPIGAPCVLHLLAVC